MTQTRSCGVQGCDKPYYQGGYCTPHYTKKYRYGDPLATGPISPNGLTRDELFLRKVSKTPEHWLWTGRINKRGNGYGQFTYRDNQTGKPKSVQAHRYGWELWVGPIPEGLHLDHVADRCTITWCIWPEHLEPVTPRINTVRHYALQTHCKHGHEFTPENTKIVYVPGGEHRICRQCGRDRTNAHYRRTHPITS